MHKKLAELFVPSQGLTLSNRSLALYHEDETSEALRPYIACYWSVASHITTDRCGIELRVIPDGCVDFVFTVSRNRACGGLLVGAMESAMTVHPEKDVETFGIRFRPGGAMPFIRQPISDFRGKAVDLTELFGPAAVLLFNRLNEVDNLRERIRILDAVMHQWAAALPPFPFDDSVANVLHKIYHTCGKISIRELAASEAVSTRHLLRRFETWTGYSPKLFCRVIRFQGAVHMIVGMQGLRANADLATECGYADQAHFVREFRTLAGISPGRYAQ